MSETISLHLGDPELDTEHVELERLVRALRDAPPEQTTGALDALRAHSARHFDAEDSDLKEVGGGNASCHLDEHAEVLRSLDEVGALLASQQVGAEARQRLVRALGTQLLDWLPRHVQEMDSGVATHRAKRRLGGVPIQITRHPRAGS